MNLLAFADAVVQRTADASYLLVTVHEPLTARLAQLIRDLSARIRELDAEEVFGRMRSRLRHFLFCLRATSLPAGHPAICPTEILLEIRSIATGVDDTELSGILQQLAESLQELSSQQLSTSAQALSAYLTTLEPGTGIAVAVPEKRFAPWMKEYLDTITPDLPVAVDVVRWPTDVRSTVYDQICFFGLQEWYSGAILKSGRAGKFIQFIYDWMPAEPAPVSWFGDHPLVRITQSEQGRSSRRYFAAGDTSLSPEARALSRDMIRTEENDIRPDPAEGLQAARGQVLNADISGETIRARLYWLEGGCAVYLKAEPSAREWSMNAACELMKRPLAELRAGDFVLLRTGHDREYVIQQANLLLGSSCSEFRQCERSWKEALALRISGSSLSSVAAELRAAGCLSAEEGNVRGWAFGATIRPDNPEYFAVIMALTGMSAETDHYWRCLSAVQTAHLRAGVQIAEKVRTLFRKVDPAILERDGRMVRTIAGTAVEYSLIQIAADGGPMEVIPRALLGHVLKLWN